VPFVSVP